MKKIWIPVLIIVILSGIFLIWNSKENKVSSETFLAEKNTATEVSDYDVNSQIDEILNVLLEIHYVSITDIAKDNSDTFLLNEMTESMNDLNKLKGLVYRTETISKSQDKIISTTGLVLQVSVVGLIKAYDSWIQYLRKIDVNSIDVPEFQYQIALFQSSTHDIYLKMIKDASLLPMITIKFAEQEGGVSSVNENIKNHLLSQIDDKFTEVLADNEIFYQKTKNRYAVAVLIQGYKDFFNAKE